MKWTRWKYHVCFLGLFHKWFLKERKYLLIWIFFQPHCLPEKLGIKLVRKWTNLRTHVFRPLEESKYTCILSQRKENSTNINVTLMWSVSKNETTCKTFRKLFVLKEHCTSILRTTTEQIIRHSLNNYIIYCFLSTFS